MITEELISLFKRDLKRLFQEIEAYADETTLWQVADGTRNSAGNLCLHLVGSLQFYVGSTLGNTVYVRNREAEFSDQHVPQRQLLGQIEATSQVVEQTLSGLSEASLSENYPEQVLGYPMTSRYFLVHLHGHLTYHLGQIDYHRRILTGGPAIRFVALG